MNKTLKQLAISFLAAAIVLILARIAIRGPVSFTASNIAFDGLEAVVIAGCLYFWGDRWAKKQDGVKKAKPED